MTLPQTVDSVPARGRQNPRSEVGRGFASTAAYFETLAAKERDSDRKQRLSEVAGFYRSLAQVIPGMPNGYKANGSVVAVTRAERWRARAEECRVLADCFTDPTCRAELRQLARPVPRASLLAKHEVNLVA